MKTPKYTNAEKLAIVLDYIIDRGAIRDNTILLQPIKRVVKNAGWSRVLFLAYSLGEDGRVFPPVVLTEDEGRALQANVGIGNALAIDGTLYKRVLVLDALHVEARQMKEYRTIEGHQRDILRKEIVPHGFYAVKVRAQYFNLGA